MLQVILKGLLLVCKFLQIKFFVCFTSVFIILKNYFDTPIAKTNYYIIIKLLIVLM